MDQLSLSSDKIETKRKGQTQRNIVGRVLQTKSYSLIKKPELKLGKLIETI